MTAGIAAQIEEVLERLWTARERGAAASVELDESALGFDPAAAVQRAIRRGWIALRADRLELTAAGEPLAAGVIRRHRLAERLLADVVQVDAETMEAAACELEHAHILSAEATDRVCAFLGHPPTCPHGRPIPRGRCCERMTRDVPPLVTPLTEGRIGGDYRIVFAASRATHRLDRLAALGVVPGARCRIRQQAPAVVVVLGGTEIALEPAAAADVYVVPA
jgi:DtxR family Mn-dependent transcriptional regulator